jgi:tetratricopeptide (TPR) repeat protein
MTFVNLGERIFRAVWRFHFHIPRAAYRLLLAVAVTILLLFDGSQPRIAAAVAVALALQGLLRWQWHRKQSGLVVVCRFSTEPGRESRAVHVQDIVMGTLADHLPPFEAALAHAVPVMVGPASRPFAARLRRRLGCYLLLHGRIDEPPGRTYAVFARVLMAADRDVIHYDWHTRDRTPARARWGHIIELLTPTPEVEATEYPLEFATELQAVIRGVMGQIALLIGDFDRAEELLRRAISVSPFSTSHQIDRLRSDLALAIAEQGRREEGLAILRDRASGEDPSPHLLRTLARLLGPQPGTRGEVDPFDREEAIRALRKAEAIDSDPENDLSLYNLAMMLGESDEEFAERKAITDRLLKTSRFYKRTWYVRRLRAALAWRDATRARAEGDEATAAFEFRRAATWYSRALQARPHLRLLARYGFEVVFYDRFEPSPILIANAHDAHREVGNSLRAWWLERRFLSIRRRFLRTASRALSSQNWMRAYAYADWAIVGRGDATEVEARTIKAVAMLQTGWHEWAEEEWAVAFDTMPLALLFRNSLSERYALPQGLPGAQPSDAESAVALLSAMGVLEANGEGSEPPSH